MLNNILRFRWWKFGALFLLLLADIIIFLVKQFFMTACIPLCASDIFLNRLFSFALLFTLIYILYLIAVGIYFFIKHGKKKKN